MCQTKAQYLYFYQISFDNPAFVTHTHILQSGLRFKRIRCRETCFEVVCGLDAHIVFREEKGPDMPSNVSSQENGRKHNSFFPKDIRAVFFHL